MLNPFRSAAMCQTAFISCLRDLTCILLANLSLLGLFQHSREGVQFSKDSNRCFFLLLFCFEHGCFGIAASPFSDLGFISLTS